MIPEDLYARLAAQAGREGMTMDGLLAVLLAEHARVNSASQDMEVVEGYDPAADPFARFAGIVETAEPGWIGRHDATFGGIGHASDE